MPPIGQNGNDPGIQDPKIANTRTGAAEINN